jgi:hypothetical protein
MQKIQQNNDTKEQDVKEQEDKDSTENSALQWTKEIDILLTSWCDNAKCFEWMHGETSIDYLKRSKIFMVIINLLTAVSGLSNIIAGNIIINGFQLIWIFGSVSILTSTLNILQDKLAYQPLAEAHRKFAAQWSIIISKIEEIVALPPNVRRDCKSFLKYIKADINQVTIDGNNLIPKNIRDACYEKFKNIPNFELPEMLGVATHTKSFFSHISINKEDSITDVLIQK